MSSLIVSSQFSVNGAVAQEKMQDKINYEKSKYSQMQGDNTCTTNEEWF